MQEASQLWIFGAFWDKVHLFKEIENENFNHRFRWLYRWVFG